MRAYVGLTDWTWYETLRATGATEANFWRPRDLRWFGATVPQGAPFLFKVHKDRGDRILGGGFFDGWVTLTIERAWEFFGTGNGALSVTELLAAISAIRGAQVTAQTEIGCILLSQIRFLPSSDLPSAPPSWSGNLVQGRSYELGTPQGSYVEEVFAQLLARDLGDDATTGVVDGPVFGPHRLMAQRLGQAPFKALVQEAYGRRCAITGERIVPVPEAAHIRPVASSGENRVDNGLLRSDVHTLFDRGCLGVHPERRTLLVSPRLRSDFGNGEEFYTMQSSGHMIAPPRRRADRPNREFLEWHADEVFLSA
ncbi:putative restriction endonuclease [Cellulosimicrobium cellulans]|nr:putative restriction endonuclease [Cellulosimicrobium cellulans]